MGLGDIKSKYLIFVLKERKPKTEVWEVRTKSDNSLLGIIKWYAQWRQYCFFPEQETVWSFGCVDDIRFFLAMANGEHANKKLELA